MADVAIVETAAIEPELEPLVTAVGRTPFSWSAAIAGALSAAAVSIIIIALGSGIGLSFASPSGGGPSATSLTIAAAVWLVMAQAISFATGGYLAARLRSRAYDGIADETTFRDAAQGFVVWALGVVAMVTIFAALTLFAADTTAHVAAQAATGISAAARGESVGTSPTDYFVDLLFRPGPATASGGSTPGSDRVGAAPSGGQPTLTPETRAEVSRILLRGISQGALDDSDRTYLAQVISARIGLSADDAQRRVAAVESKVREAAKQAADKTAKAGAYFSFWTFMSLLFGGAAATLAGMLGGQLRDDAESRRLAGAWSEKVD